MHVVAFTQPELGDQRLGFVFGFHQDVAELSAAVEVAVAHGRHVAAHAHGASGMKNALRAGVHSIEHATLMDDDAAEMMTQRHVYMVPTLSALATTAACPTGCGIPDSARSKARNMVKQHERSFRAALRRGVPIAMGTDAGTPFNYHGDNAGIGTSGLYS